MKFVRPAPTILIASIVAGVILAIGLLFTWRSFANLPPMIAGVVFLGCSVLLSGAMLTILQCTRSRWSAVELRSRVLWLSACTLAGWLLTWMIPLSPAPAPGTAFSVEVVSLGQHSDASKGAEVWARLVVDGRTVELDDVKAGPTWIAAHGYLVSPINSPPDAFKWDGYYTSSVNLQLFTHPWSGKAVVRWNGIERTFDLYSATGSNIELPLASANIPSSTQFLILPSRTPLQYVVQASQSMALGLLLLAFLSICRSWPNPCLRHAVRPEGSIGKEALLAAAPLLVIGSALLVIFLPAILTTDSLGQWAQARTGNYNDAHPVLYAFYLWVVQQVYPSPTLAAWLQMAAMAMASGWLATVVRRACNAPRWTSIAGGLLIATYPLTALTSITLWKDVPYGTSVAALTAFVVSNVFLDRPSLRRWYNGLALALLAAACIALRHNGPPVAAAAFLILLCRPGNRLRTIGYMALAVGLAWGIKGPLADNVGTERTSAAYMAYTHHLSAHLAAGQHPRAATDAAILDAIDVGRDDWRYRCSMVNTTIFNEAYSIPTAVKHQNDLFRIWLQMALERPDVEANHLLCASGMVWRFQAPPDGPLYLYSFGFQPRDPLGLQWVQPGWDDAAEASPAPAVAAWIGRTLLRDKLTGFWRPAPFLVGLLLLATLAYLRTRDRRILLIPALVIAHSAVLMVAIIAQDARYQLPVYLVTLAVAPALALSRRTQPQRIEDGRAAG